MDSSITLRNGLQYPETIATLFEEYTGALISGCPEFAEYLSLQNYEHELENPASKYGADGNHLWIVEKDGQTAGCVGLLKMDQERVELKRFYILPEYRNQGFGSLLLAMAINQAKADGYKSMWLDTLPGLDAAFHLYRKNGFRECLRYNNSPLQSSVFLKLDLI